MKPKLKSKAGQHPAEEPTSDKDVLAMRFPGLAIPNKAKEGNEDKQQESVVDDMMAELEAMAPPTEGEPSSSKNVKKVEKIRNRSPDKKRKRSRSPRRRSKSRDRNRRSRSRDYKRRSRSKDRRKRSRSRSRDRRRRSRSRSRDHKRNRRSRSREERKKVEIKDDPEIGKIYNGKVVNTVGFGCFVQLMGLRKKWEGLVHISQLRSEGRVTKKN